MNRAGDWFNRLDWGLHSNNFGVGLPPAAKNRNFWDSKRPLLANAALKPSPRDISRGELLQGPFACANHRNQNRKYMEENISTNSSATRPICKSGCEYLAHWW